MKHVRVEESMQWIPTVRAGETVLLSGTVYTARDAAHKRIAALLETGGELPFPLKGSFVYYAGPTPAPEGKICGSFGPTTSCRMDGFAPMLYDCGMCGTIGKGGRSGEVAESIRKNGGIYLIAVGGAGAFCASKISSCKEIAFFDLGCESVKQLTFDAFPLTVAIDLYGGDLFAR